MQHIRVTRLEKSHVPALAQAERTMCVRTLEYPADAEISGTYDVLEPWAWTEAMIIEAASRFADKKGLVKDTRSWVARVDTKQEDPRSGKQESTWPVAGGLIYEIHDDGYEILLLTVNLEMVKDVVGARFGPYEVLSDLVNIVLDKARGSEKRKRASIHIPDGHWMLVRLFMSIGWGKPTRKDRFFVDGNDAWYFERTMERSELCPTS